MLVTLTADTSIGPCEGLFGSGEPSTNASGDVVVSVAVPACYLGSKAVASAEVTSNGLYGSAQAVLAVNLLGYLTFLGPLASPSGQPDLVRPHHGDSDSRGPAAGRQPPGSPGPPVPRSAHRDDLPTLPAFDGGLPGRTRVRGDHLAPRALANPASCSADPLRSCSFGARRRSSPRKTLNPYPLSDRRVGPDGTAAGGGRIRLGLRSGAHRPRGLAVGGVGAGGGGRGRTPVRDSPRTRSGEASSASARSISRSSRRSTSPAFG